MSLEQGSHYQTSHFSFTPFPAQFTKQVTVFVYNSVWVHTELPFVRVMWFPAKAICHQQVLILETQECWAALKNTTSFLFTKSLCASCYCLSSTFNFPKTLPWMLILNSWVSLIAPMSFQADVWTYIYFFKINKKKIIQCAAFTGWWCFCFFKLISILYWNSRLGIYMVKPLV